MSFFKGTIFAVAFVLLLSAAGAAEDLEVLMYQLETGSPEEREQATWQLQGDETAIPLLTEALYAENEELRADAAFVLCDMPADYLYPALSPLIEVLTDPHWRVRANAAFALGKMGSAAAEADEMLAELIMDSDARVRRAAAHALGQIAGRPDLVAQALSSALEDPDRDTRWAAATSLGKLGADGADSLSALVVASNRDRSGWVRVAAVNSLGEIGEPSDAALGALETALDDPVDEVVYAATQSLAKLGKPAIPILVRGLEMERSGEDAAEALAGIGPEAVPALTEALSGSNPKVREAAVAGFGALGEAAVPALVELTQHDNLYVRRSVALALKRTHIETPEVFEALAILVRDEKTNVRLAVVETLPQFETYSMTLPLVTKALDDSSSLVRAKATESIGRIAVRTPIDTAIPRLIQLVSDKDVTVRRGAIEALMNLAFPPAELLPALIQALGDRDLKVRQLAVQAIGRHSTEAKEAVPYLIPLLQDTDRDLQLYTIEALALMGPAARSAAPTLVDLIYDPNEVGEKAAYGLGQVAEADIVPDLITALGNETPNVRVWAATALWFMGPKAKAAVPYLQVALDDPNMRVRMQAEFALDSITGKK